MFDWFFELFYNLAVLPCKVIDILIDVFRGLIGLSNVSISTSSGTEPLKSDILSYILTQGAIFQILFAVAFVAFVMVLLFGLLQVVRAIINDEGGKTTPGRVFKRCMKSLCVMVILPAVVLGGIYSSTILMRGLDKATIGGGENPSIGGGIMAISFDVDDVSMWRGEIWISIDESKHKLNEDNAVSRESRQKFIDEVIRNNDGINGYDNISYIRKFVVMKNLRYMSLMSILAGFIGLFVIGMGAFTIGVRLWNIVLMYVTSPAFCATIPFDDGARFKIWREIFIGKVLSCYGMILAINIFVRLSGLMFNVQLFAGNAFANMIVQVFIILSGLLCISGANQLFAQLIGSNAGGAENEQARAIFRGVMGGGMLAKSAIKGGFKLAKNSPDMTKKMYGGMRAVGDGVRNTALRAGAGATFLTSKMGGRGASMHDKMMTALHGNNYKGSIEERRRRKAEYKEYRENEGMTNREARKIERGYGKLFGRQERYEGGGYVGQRKAAKEKARQEKENKK